MKLLASYDDFSGGELGTASLMRAPRTFWTGRNIAITPGGGLTPRLGVQEITPSGMTADSARLMGYVDGETGLRDSKVWWGQFNGTEYEIQAVKVFTGGVPDNNEPVVTYTNTLGIGEAPIAYVDGFPRYSYMVTTGRVYGLDHNDEIVVDFDPFGAPLGCEAIACYGDFLVVGGEAANPTRIQWSDANTFGGAWAATNFFDLLSVGVGSNERITGLRVQQDRLLIFMGSGRIFVVSGTLGVNQTVREFLPGDLLGGPYSQEAIALANDGTMWYQRESSPAHVPTDSSSDHVRYLVPMRYTGGERIDYPAQDRWLLMTTGNDDTLGPRSLCRTAQLPSMDGIVYATFLRAINGNGDLRMLYHRAGRWERHMMETPVPNTWDLRGFVAGVRGDVYLLFNFEGGGTAPKLYRWQVENLDPPEYGMFNPSFTELDGAAPPPHHLTLPWLIAEPRTEVSVHHLELYVRRYDNELTPNLDIEADVSALDPYGQDGPITVTATASDDDTPVDPTYRRVRLSVPQLPMARTHEITFTKLYGAVLERVDVFGDITNPATP